jgi:hypothetical protein
VTRLANISFVISKSALNRSLVLLPCLFLIALNAQYASAIDLDEDLAAGKIQRNERLLGPFQIEGKDFTAVIKELKFPGASTGWEETVESFSIVDQDGRVHFEKSFPLEYDDTGFRESWDIGGTALDGRGPKGFRKESGVLIELPPMDRPGAGLVLYYGFIPSAPGSGWSCQVFAMRGNDLAYLYPPLSVYGRIYQMEPGTSPNSRRLFENDTMRFGVHTGWFEVVVPLRVFDGLRVVPLHYSAPHDYYACDVVVERIPLEEDTFVRFFPEPGASSIPRHVIMRKDTKVEFIYAYTRVSIESGGDECSISVDDMPWLKVRIDGEEGFVREAEDLLALGLLQSG